MRATYQAAPDVLFRLARPLLRPWHRADSPFLDRLITPYSDAVRSMGSDHWAEKVRAFGLVGHGRVLDLGCGPGQWLLPLATANRSVVAVERDVSMLHDDRARLKGTPTITYVQCRAEELAFGTSTFDAVLCYSVLMYTDHEVAVRELFRVLRPGGTITLGLVGMGYYLRHIVEGLRCGRPEAVRYGLEPILSLWGHRLTGGTGRAVTYWDRRRMMELLHRHGFEVLRVFPERKDRQWPLSYLGTYFFFCAQARKPAPPA
jgi:SAM-dependent methyltransferase